MAMVVQHNAAAQLALVELNKNNKNLGKLLAKVSSGQKINSAQDDASSYVISEKMREMVRTLNQDHQNVQNGSSLFKVADGGISSIVEELRNLKELAINSANDTNTDVDRLTIQKVFDQKKMNINDIATETDYNTKRLLDGSLGNSATAVTFTRTIPGSPGSGNEVDIVLVIDDTGSMSSPIASMAANIGAFTDELASRGFDWRIGLVRYGDPDFESIPFSSGEFSTDAEEIAEKISELTAHGGGDEPEAGYEGVMEALSYNFRESASRQIFALTDASVHDLDDGSAKGKYSAGDMVRNLKAKYATFSIVGNSSSLKDWRPLVKSTNGRIYNIHGDYGKQMVDFVHHIPKPPSEIEEVVYGANSPFVIHHGPKANQATKFYINDMHTKSLGTGKLFDDYGLPTNDEDLARYDALSYDEDLQSDWLETLKSAQHKNLDKIDVITKKNANVAVRVIDGAIEYALNEATRIGSYLQRLDYTDSNLVVMNENVQAAESTIRDADMAKEMTEYTKFNILTQSAQAMLAQANQNGSQVLSLLQ